MKEIKVEREELKLHIEELEERIAPSFIVNTPGQGAITPPVNDQAEVATGHGVVTDDRCGPGEIPPC